MNHPHIQDSFEAVAKRIKDELVLMESPGGFMVGRTQATTPIIVTKTTQEKPTDYWVIKKNNPKYKDRQGEVWTDQGLDSIWKRWLRSFMRKRLDKVENEITTKLSELDTDQKTAQKDCNISQQKKDRIVSRYRRLARAWTATKPLQNPAP